ncbi:MAG TPA: ATP-dependent DNA ligase [Bryobacteraceae bacterium]|nr:ATP-dependent DNA ligase [Bryobacteraceae bacterium]
MDLPVNPPILPMLSKRIDELPSSGDLIFEPKWDGFRALVFRDGDEIFIQSRDEKSLNRYFPELLDPLRAHLPNRSVLDGEIVLAKDGCLDFEALQLRLHPAASRVKLLSREIPASVVFFDLLSEGDRDLRGEPFERRRQQLESLLASAAPPIHLTPATRDMTIAADWFSRFEGAGLDGVMAKPISGAYEPGKRVMLKVKHERDCDCVVAGFRWHRKREKSEHAEHGEQQAVGSLLLGLFDHSGALQHVGVCASFSQEKRLELVEFLAPYREDALRNHPWKAWAAAGEEGHRIPGGQSRWSQGKDLSWEPLRPELVLEVAYEHMQGSRFRHMAQFRRWRTDRKPAECSYAQLEVVPPQELMEIFGA